jgi:hypothetical protein
VLCDVISVVTESMVSAKGMTPRGSSRRVLQCATSGWDAQSLQLVHHDHTGDSSWHFLHVESLTAKSLRLEHRGGSLRGSSGEP